MKDTRFLVMGSPRVCLSLSHDRPPDKGEILHLYRAPLLQPGDFASRAAMALSALGSEVFFLGKVGDDTAGSLARDLLRRAGVDDTYLTVSPDAGTGMTCTLSLRGEEKESGFCFGGEGKNLQNKEVESAFSSEPDALFLTAELPSGILRYAASLAHDRKIPVFLDLAGVGDDAEDFPACDVLISGMDETEKMTGIRPGIHPKCLEAAVRLSEKIRASHCLLTLAERGCFRLSGRLSGYSPAYETESCHPIGAGAVFAAAFCALRMSTDNLNASAAFANAAAALSVSSEGFAPPTRAEIARFLRERQNES